MTATRGSIRRSIGALVGAVLILAGLLPVAAAPVALAATPVFLNEIHYDNTGTDAGEAIEVAGPAGTDLTGWSIVLYNGANGLVYDTDALSGTIDDEAGGYGAISLSYPENGIQNGAPDGIALVNGSTVVQFLSYEGTFAALDGPATGLTSTDIGVSETGGEALGMSLQLVGTGTTYEQFTWQAPATASFGAINVGQTFGEVVASEPVINEFVANHVGADSNEYVEVRGDPSTDYSAYTILHIEGDGTGAGVIDTVIDVGTTGASGHWVTGFLNNELENGTITLLLVRDFTGVDGSDLDTDNDGTLDGTPWAEVVDGVAVSDGGASDRTYATPVLAPGFGGSPFTPGGASRIPDGLDTDAPGDWIPNDFDLAGIAGFVGTPAFGEALNTPGAANRRAPVLVINEVDYDQPSTDTAEFLELRNVSQSTVGLDDVTVELVNGSSGAIYQTIDLPAVSLAAGDYFVICANAANTPNCDLDVEPDENLIQNGAPDAIGLRMAGVLVDAVSYEGNTIAPYTEGSGTGLEDSSSAASVGISRCPDGADTDQNNVDFAQRPATPGGANNCPGSGPELGECGDEATLIHAIQGSGLLSPMLGQAVVVEGVVVGDFQNNASPDNGELNGFNVQEEDAEADADPTTSEGIFVFAPSAPDVSTGAVVRVLGTVTEFGSNGTTTELTNTSVLLCEEGTPLPAATAVTLPVTDVADFERWEGMLVTLPQALAISEFFNFDRFNEIVLTLGRQHQPTAVAEPGSPEAEATAEANRLGRITLDDGRTASNPDPAIHPNGDVFDLTNRFRGGDTVQNATGVIEHSFGIYRIHPTQGADYTPQNLRPEEPEDVGGSLTVASFNVLNYFTTIDTGADICGPAEDQECRGADTLEELERQRAKIISALTEIDADVVGLIEIENHPGDVPTADLVSGLNDALGAGTYDYIATGAIGPDAIRVALIYKPATVTPVGGYATLDSSIDPRFDESRSRPPLAQTFTETATGAVFTVVVNHLKSKGSDCGGPPDDDPIQGNCNGTRLAAARALVDWLAGDPTGSGDRDVLIMGDLNAYDKEDPIDAVRAGADDIAGSGDDYTDLVFEHQGELAYSYLFDGQLGYLDHALGSPTVTAQVTGTTVWHINADEPDILDYDMSFKEDAQDALFEENAYRSSDHDPVIVGLDLRPSYDFDGFYPPVGTPPAAPSSTETARAGSSIPLRFSLGGDFGLGVVFGTPQVFLDTDWPTGPSVDATGTLSYDAVDDTYKFEWKTAKSFADSTRTLELVFDDGTYRTLTVEFR